MNTTPNEAAARGLKLLSAKHRKLHPHAQVQTLRRIAVRALEAADWNEELAGRYPNDSNYKVDAAKQRVLRAKASDATEACIWLNQEHKLGYPTGGAR